MNLVKAPVHIASFLVLLPRPNNNAIPSSSRVYQFSLHILQGSIVGFCPSRTPGAIVNAANTLCLGGGGVDGAISDAGGPNLHRDRLQLPIIHNIPQGQAIRCPTGSAVVTGPGTYGALHVPYVIHAVGPNYKTFEPSRFHEADALLQSAYLSCLQRGKDHKIKCIAFSLLSAGVYRGKRSLKDILKIGLDSIIHFDGYTELKEISVCAFSKEEIETLMEIIQSLEKDGWVRPQEKEEENSDVLV